MDTRGDTTICHSCTQAVRMALFWREQGRHFDGGVMEQITYRPKFIKIGHSHLPLQHYIHYSLIPKETANFYGWREETSFDILKTEILERKL